MKGHVKSSTILTEAVCYVMFSFCPKFKVEMYTRTHTRTHTSCSIVHYPLELCFAWRVNAFQLRFPQVQKCSNKCWLWTVWAFKIVCKIKLVKIKIIKLCEQFIARINDYTFHVELWLWRRFIHTPVGTWAKVAVEWLAHFLILEVPCPDIGSERSCTEFNMFSSVTPLQFWDLT
jgi:hypothetical protein